MKASLVLIETLRSAGVDTIFALSGNQIMPLFDACLEADMRVVHVRHEAAAVYAAEAHARAAGGVGAAMVTAGAGLCNAVAPLLTSRESQTPVLLLSGDSEAALDGRGGFQEMDQVSVTMSVTKSSRRITEPGHIPAQVSQAVATALSGIPGPVHLALAADVLTADCDPAPEPDRKGSRAAELPEPAPSEALRRGFARAERPLVLAGPALGAARHADDLRALEERLGAPVLLMESPRGLNDPRLGDFKSVARRADMVVCLGKPVDFTLAYGAGPFPDDCDWYVYLADPRLAEQARRNLANRLREARDPSPSQALAMLARLEPAGRIDAEWRKSVNAAVERRDFGGLGDVSGGRAGSGLNSLSLGLEAAKILSSVPDAAVVCDGGEIGQWMQALLTRHIVMVNGVSGAIGGGLSYAMGLKLARPEKSVFAFMGDGTVGFHLAEFETAMREGLPVTAVIGNDSRWNAEVKIQERDYGPDRVFACGLGDARYDEVAIALGGHGEHVTEAKDLAPAFARALGSGKPACINVVIDGLAAPVIA